MLQGERCAGSTGRTTPEKESHRWTGISSLCSVWSSPGRSRCRSSASPTRRVTRRSASSTPRPTPRPWTCISTTRRSTRSRTCPFGAISSYLDVPAGNHNVKVYATGDTTSPVIDADVSLAAGGMYTVAATNAVASIEAQVIVDKPQPSCDAAAVRVVHSQRGCSRGRRRPGGHGPCRRTREESRVPGRDRLPVRFRPAATTSRSGSQARRPSRSHCRASRSRPATAYSVFAIGSAATPAVGDKPLQVVVAVDATASADARASTSPTPPATDTVASPSHAATEGIGLGAAALAAAGAVVFVIGFGRRFAPARRDRD